MTLDFSFMDDSEGKESRSEIAPAGRLDLEQAKRSFEKFGEMVDALTVQVNSFEVKTDEDATQLSELLGKMASTDKKIDKRRKQIIEKPDTFVRSVNRFVKPIRDRVQSVIRSGKSKIGQWNTQKELARREEERKLREAHEKKQRELDKVAEEKGIEKVALDQPVLPKTKEPIRTETGTVSSTLKWTWELEDLEKVPRKFLTLDKRAVDVAVKGGAREIDGIRIYQTSDVRIRTA